MSTSLLKIHDTKDYRYTLELEESINGLKLVFCDKDSTGVSKFWFNADSLDLLIMHLKEAQERDLT